MIESSIYSYIILGYSDLLFVLFKNLPGYFRLEVNIKGMLYIQCGVFFIIPKSFITSLLKIPSTISVCKVEA